MGKFFEIIIFEGKAFAPLNPLADAHGSSGCGVKLKFVIPLIMTGLNLVQGLFFDDKFQLCMYRLLTNSNYFSIITYLLMAFLKLPRRTRHHQDTRLKTRSGARLRGAKGPPLHPLSPMPATIIPITRSPLSTRDCITSPGKLPIILQVKPSAFSKSNRIC